MDTPYAIVIELPETFSTREARKLRRELKNKVLDNKPCVVVDLSRLKKIDVACLEALLSCMEEVAKQDGALQLGGVSPEAAVLLELTRMDRLLLKFPVFSMDVPSIALSPEPVAEEVPSEGSVQLPVAA
jgi:anti-anti-sigma factor